MADEKSTKAERPENPTAEFLGSGDARNFAVEGNDLNGYIGVSPEYMTYADATHKPLSTDEEVIPTVEQLTFEDLEPNEGSDKKSGSTPERSPAEVQAPTSKSSAPTKATTISK